ncbi:hypothetical protein D3C81_1750010 [compost metagenome]
MWGKQLAAVNGCRHCCDLLNRCNRYALAESCSCQLHRPDLGWLEQNTARFPVQINACLRSEAKITDIFEQGIFTKPLPQCYKSGVA